MNVMAVIPARYGSTRFPGKPLAMLAGKPMVQHVYERARQASSVSRVLVATDDERILRAVAEFGGEAVATRADHRSGTERMAEVAAGAAGAGAEVFVNVQGDEPLIHPAAIDAAVEALVCDAEVQVSTICLPIAAPEDLLNPGIVKVVVDFQGDALYFSRAPVPWVRDEKPEVRVQHWKHLGLYVYRKDLLLEFPTLPPGVLEKIEQLEQLRLLENGYKIRVVETEHDSIGVDTPEDAKRVEKILLEVTTE